MIKLEPEEKELLDSFNRGEWQSVPNVESEIRRYQGYAKATTGQTRQLNIQILQSDLFALEETASEKGISHQTLISSILHDYVSNHLKRASATGKLYEN